jgi:hypothetical protein
MIAQADASLGPERQVMVGEIMSHLQQQAAAVPLFAYQFVYAAASDLKWRPRPDDVIPASEMRWRA